MNFFNTKSVNFRVLVSGGVLLLILGAVYFFGYSETLTFDRGEAVMSDVATTSASNAITNRVNTATNTKKTNVVASVIPEINTYLAASATPMLIVPLAHLYPAEYDAKILELANLPHLKVASSTTASSTATSTIARRPGPWPVTRAPYPKDGALLPFHRIVAYYGNLFSKQMGVLGKYPADQMLAMLASTTAAWTAADPATPAIPALDYIVTVAQGSAGFGGKYRSRMPPKEIDKVIALAAQVHGIVILDVQVGLSDVRSEVPLLAPYLKLPQVHLALDPEFAMHGGKKPGTIIGTMDAADINFVAQYLAQLVRDNNLPPKVLFVHRFTKDMLTNYKKITPLPEVEIVIDMDGFGYPAKKIGTYTQVVVPEPVQFTGFKLFYVNDVATGHMMTPKEVLKLSPRPSFIQYQ